MTASLVLPMTGQDLNRLNDRNRKAMLYARHRTDGWKAKAGGQWLYGFLSEGQAYEALGLRQD